MSYNNIYNFLYLKRKLCRFGQVRIQPLPSAYIQSILSYDMPDRVLYRGVCFDRSTCEYVDLYDHGWHVFVPSFSRFGNKRTQETLLDYLNYNFFNIF